MIQKISGGMTEADDVGVWVGGTEYALDDASFDTKVLAMEFARRQLDAAASLKSWRDFYIKCAVAAGKSRHDYLNRVLFGPKPPTIATLVAAQIDLVSAGMESALAAACKSTKCTIGPFPDLPQSKDLIKSPSELHRYVNLVVEFNNAFMIHGMRPPRLDLMPPPNFIIDDTAAPTSVNTPSSISEYTNAAATIIDFLLDSAQALVLLEGYHRMAHRRLASFTQWVESIGKS